MVEPTHLKNMIVKLDQFPNFRDENNKNLWVATTQRSQWASYLFKHMGGNPKIEVGPENGWWKPWKTLLKWGWFGGDFPQLFSETSIWPIWNSSFWCFFSTNFAPRYLHFHCPQPGSVFPRQEDLEKKTQGQIPHPPQGMEWLDHLDKIIKAVGKR